MARPTKEAPKIDQAIPAKHSSRGSATYPQRPRELQDWLNHHCYHPLAWRLAKRLVSLPVTPNMVSVFGAFLVVAAAIVYVQDAWSIAPLIGLLLHMSWHVVDGADGDLARLTKRSSPHGEMIDGLCDYASHTILYILLGVALQAMTGPLAWLATLAAGLSRVVQANYYEVQRRQYQWWAYATTWLGQDNDGSNRAGKDTLLARMGQAYLTLAGRLSPDPRRIDRILVIAQADPAATADLRAMIRRHARLLLPETPLLGANWRTIMLGLSMIAGSPLYYFLYEAIVLNLLLVRSIARSKRQVRLLEEKMDQTFAARMSR